MWEKFENLIIDKCFANEHKSVRAISNIFLYIGFIFNPITLVILFLAFIAAMLLAFPFLILLG